MNEVESILQDINPEALTADGLGQAIVGFGGQYPMQPVAVYDYDKCVEVFMEQGMSEEEAIEWMEFNVVSAYLGEGTPIFIKMVPPGDAAHLPPGTPVDWEATSYGEQK
tara:strand:- start:3350 stop:3676 length:327 start_codon:yes stop_codon:yes gene_type:complete